MGDRRGTEPTDVQGCVRGQRMGNRESVGGVKQKLVGGPDWRNGDIGQVHLQDLRRPLFFPSLSLPRHLVRMDAWGSTMAQVPLLPILATAALCKEMCVKEQEESFQPQTAESSPPSRAFPAEAPGSVPDIHLRVPKP